MMRRLKKNILTCLNLQGCFQENALPLVPDSKDYMSGTGAQSTTTAQSSTTSLGQRMDRHVGATVKRGKPPWCVAGFA